MTTQLDLDALEALEKKATPGPWRFEQKWRGTHASGGIRAIVTAEHALAVLVHWTDRLDDAALIAAMRNALPELIRRARRCEKLERDLHDLADENIALRLHLKEKK